VITSYVVTIGEFIQVIKSCLFLKRNMYISNKNAFIVTIFLFLEQASMVHPTVNIIQQNILLVYFIVYPIK